MPSLISVLRRKDVTGENNNARSSRMKVQKGRHSSKTINQLSVTSECRLVQMLQQSLLLKMSSSHTRACTHTHTLTQGTLMTV